MSEDEGNMFLFNAGVHLKKKSVDFKKSNFITKYAK